MPCQTCCDHVWIIAKWSINLCNPRDKGERCALCGVSRHVAEEEPTCQSN